MISASIIADSVSPVGDRITTFVLAYPRFFHSELMTHRAFSRNAASSRAIPIQKMIKNIWDNPAMPVSWGQNGKGMQAKGELPLYRAKVAKLVWLTACKFACFFSWLLYQIGVHKQIANRVTEPFAHITTLVTATDFGNFFALRAHPDAQPEFQALARMMLSLYLESTPRKLNWREWHLPFVDEETRSNLSVQDCLKISTARAARVSYLNFEGKIDYNKDFKLHDDLLASGHMSPFEHAARPEPECACPQSNFKGYMQYRKMVAGENRSLTLEEMQKLNGAK